MESPTREAIAAYVTAVVLMVLVVVIYKELPSNTLAFSLGIPAGGLSGFLVTLGTYLLQQPSFSVRVAEDKYDRNSGPWFFLHVLVKNESRGFLGGGVAIDCRGQLTVKSQTFTPKWASRPEPLSWHLVQTSAGTVTPVPWLDWSKMEESKVEVLGYGDERSLDIVVKVDGDEKAYVHEPENYRDPQHKGDPNSEGALPPGVHTLNLVLKHRGGKSRVFKIRVNNQDSKFPETVSICVVR